MVLGMKTIRLDAGFKSDGLALADPRKGNTMKMSRCRREDE
jgi:hypothetical protein